MFCPLAIMRQAYYTVNSEGQKMSKEIGWSEFLDDYRTYLDIMVGLAVSMEDFEEVVIK